jgi:photosystem II stability/assembly factor-like uncharacterized protein
MCFSASCREKDNMVQWQQLTTHTTKPIYCLAMVTPDTGYAFGGDRFWYGMRLSTYDGGNTWRADSIHRKVIKTVFFLDRHRGIATGQEGFFFTTNDAGQTWQYVPPQTWEYIQAIAFSDPTHGIAVGGESYHHGRMMTYNAFAAQTSFDSTDRHELTDVAFSSLTNAIAVGYGIVQRTTDAGKTWSLLPVTGDNYRAVCFPSQNTGYIVGLSGTILKTTDEGRTWKELQAPATFSANGELRDIAFANDNTGFICGSNGLLLTTTNGGASWKTLEGLPKVRFNALTIKEKTAWLMGDNGTLIKLNF